MTEKIKVTEALFENWLDDKIKRALRTDTRYTHAENAEAQAEAEEEISNECEAELLLKYEVS